MVPDPPFALYVMLGRAVQIAYSVRPFAGMVMACDFEYDTPLPVLEVSHRDRT